MTGDRTPVPAHGSVHVPVTGLRATGSNAPGSNAPGSNAYRPPWRAYRALSSTALKSVLAYRFQFFMALMGNTFLVLTMLYLWRTILASGAQAGFSWPQMKAYLLVSFVANTIVSGLTEWRMAARIRDGMVAIDLTKPIDYQRARFAEAVGFAAFEYFTGTVLVLIALLVFGGVPVPHGLHLLLFAVSIVLVLPLRFSLVYATALLCFWTQNYMGINWARLAITNLMSGALVPLPFFPGWLQLLGKALPFQGMAYTPAMLYLDRFSNRDAVLAVLVQLAWSIALWFGAAAAWRAASRRLTVHGG
ncbi:MAG: ABC-2 family transporter protein [Actinomycetota bacterium]